MSEVVIESVFKDLYRAEIPLPRNPLKATNTYIIRGKDRNLIIDTGMNRKECLEAMIKVLNDLKIDMYKTDIFVTHLHADHVGLADTISSQETRVFFNRPDAEILNNQNLWDIVRTFAEKHGFSRENVDQAIDSHPGQRYSPKRNIDFVLLGEGDKISYGGYELRCVVTPGHTPGHTCLFEPDKKLLFSGDTILGDITPNISAWADSGNPLGQFLSSLEKLKLVDYQLVLPGHRSLIKNGLARIEELKEHHRNRLEEVIVIIKSLGFANAYQVAQNMNWDIIANSWNDYPLMQKWFATGEALAHIRHLQHSGLIVERDKKGVIEFSTTSN